MAHALTNTVVFLDDETERATVWEKSLQELFGKIGLAGWSTTVLTHKELQDTVAVLSDRRRGSVDGSANSLIDNAGVLVIDFDLTGIEHNGQYVTGDSIAYLARTYTSCGVLVGLNQYDRSGPTFDLTLLDHPESFSDVHVNDTLLASEGLWTPAWNEGSFRPWCWPVIPDLMERLTASRDFVLENLESNLLDALELSAANAAGLPTRALTFFSHSEKDLEDLTLADISQTSAGLKGKETIKEKEQLAVLVEARLRKWVENIVLPEQDEWVDLPHLVEQYPKAILESDPNGRRSVCRPTPLSLGVLDDGVKSHQVMRALAVRPIVSRSALKNDPDVFPKIVGGARAASQAVFAEDISGYSSVEDAYEFRSELELGRVTRYVKKIDNIRYQPVRNLLV